MELPVYETKNYRYVRISDVDDSFKRLEFERFMFGKTMPLIQGEKGTITDAVFFDDYKLYLDYINGSEAFFD